MPESSQRMERLAQSVADGEPVDWAKEEREAKDPQEAAMVKRLRTVSALADAHRAPDRPSVPASSPSPLRASDFFMPQAKAPVTPFAKWGPLEIVKKLGEGAFADVYLAKDSKLDREVALKILRERSGRGGTYEAMLQEARLFAKLRHNNVATVYGAEIFEDRPGFWMERIRGKSLDALLDERGAFGAREAAGIGVELCRALAAVHGAGLVHRDVKAANVMREEGGRIVLMDFGAGRDREAESGASMAGTPLYMAPELFRKQAATAQSDLYSLGVLLYQLVTRQYPIEAQDMKGLLDAHERNATHLLRDRRPDLPEPFVRAVETALMPDPAKRFRSAGEMERALVESLGATTTLAEPPAPSRKPVWVALFGFALLAAGAFYALESKGEKPAEPAASRLVDPQPTLRSQPEPKAQAAPRSQAESAKSISIVEPVKAAVEPLRLSAKIFKIEDASRQPVESGVRLQPGDQIEIEVESKEDVFVYVFALDASGSAYALFPEPGSEDRNPLRAGSPRRVPDSALRVMGAGKSERILLVASREANLPLQSDANEKPRQKQLRTLERMPLSEEANERRLRARKGSESAFPEDGALRKIASAAQALPNKEGDLGEVWAQIFDFELPAIK